METVDRLAAATAKADTIVAVGSGTINDLCKFVAARTGKPYAVFATAPSMNGYVSVNAAITDHGHKKSLSACAPTAAIFDLNILSAAPKRMIRSGLGDSLCRPTSQADWLLAHMLLGQPFRQAPYALLAEDEPAMFASAAGLIGGDLDAMERLVRTLVLSGFGTAICGSSHPASQGEHLISHFADMLGDPNWPPAFHGEQVGVATLTMAALQSRCLEVDLPRVRTDRVAEKDFSAIFGETLGAECWAEFSQKRITQSAAENLNEVLASRWTEIRATLRKVVRPAAELEHVLRQAGAPIRPSEIGWPADFYAKATANARYIRNRFTFLDFAAAIGVAP
jgi:glycerol-1-phosphate dehydrogenase [NAD(P)+]